MSPELIERLKHIAETAKHHPQPAVVVAALAQLLLDAVNEIQSKAPMALRFISLMGFDAAKLDATLDKLQAEMDAAAVATDADVGEWPAVAEGSGDQTAA